MFYCQVIDSATVNLSGPFFWHPKVMPRQLGTWPTTQLLKLIYMTTDNDSLWNRRKTVVRIYNIDG